MSMYALLRSSPEAPSMHTIEDALAGNLCRCTGYRPILDAFAAFADVDPSIYSDEAILSRPSGTHLVFVQVPVDIGSNCGPN